MNILSIENKFKALDDKEKQVRQYFNPKSFKGKKHHYISDIRADFHYDTLLYGLGMFWNQESDEIKIDKIDEDKIEKTEEARVETFKTPIPSTIIETKDKSPQCAKRRNLKLLEMQKPLVKEVYPGSFSATKVLGSNYLYKKPIANFGKSGWKTAAIGDRNIKNRAAREEIIYSARIKDCTNELRDRIQQNKCDSPHRLNRSDITKSISKEEFESYLAEFKQLVFTGKEQPKFHLDLNSLRKETPEILKVEEKPQLFQILFQISPIIIIKSSNDKVSVSLTDISAQDFPTKHFPNLITEGFIVQNNGIGSFDLISLFGKKIEKHTIRVLIQGENECFDYYVSLQEYEENLEENVRKQIIEYKLAIFEAIKSHSKQRIVVPLTWDREKSNVVKAHKMILPKIASRSKPATSRKRDYANPLTSALFSYKQNTESFHPQAYPANLTIFEAHDFIEENYTLPPKAKATPQRPLLQLAVNGFGLNNSFLNL